MQTKKIYIGQELTQQDWDFGLGSVYLSGPRNVSKESWRVEVINKLENSGSNLCLLIPETKSQLKTGICSGSNFEWQKVAMSVASCILFWYPSGVQDAQGYAEFGAWHKSERVFMGRENAKGNEYLDWIWHQEQKLYPAESIDQLIEMVLHWIRE